uniref:Uncharacterized protein n=1 Tax=Megaviridae environmental sample TaxID=1737588 RepID=A0A5J6VKQ6_9VIRU|nr:MAG: hypothetical protein [Megaviridae environmental sample]
MQNRLNEFMFNLDTLELLSKMNKSRDELVHTLESVDFNSHMVSLVLDNRSLLDSVLLRLNVDENHTESHMRETLSKLHHEGISQFLNYLFRHNQVNVTTNNHHETHSVQSTSNHNNEVAHESNTTLTTQEQNTVSEDSDVEEDDMSLCFTKFMKECIEESNNEDDSVKLSQAYLALNTWWESAYNTNVPDKKEFKAFLTESFGKATKNSWNNIRLSVE